MCPLYGGGGPALAVEQAEQDLRRLEEALAAIEEAVAIRRELAAARPDAFRPDLATALNTLSVRLTQV